MRRGLWLALLPLLPLLLASNRTAWAEGEPQQAPPSPAQQVADAALAAADAGDDETIASLAAQGRADPWLVVDRLLELQRADVATRFAEAAPPAGHEKLGAYAALRAASPTPDLARRMLSDVQAALQTQDPARALELAAQAEIPTTTLTGVRLVHARSIAVMQLGSLVDAQGSFGAAAEAAAALGWTARAALLYHWAGLCAAQQGLFIDTGALWEKRLALVEALGDASNVAVTLSNLGSIASQRGDLAKALTFQERSLPIVEALGDPRRTATVLGNLAVTYSRRGEFEAAIAALEKALALEEAAGGPSMMVLGNLASVKSSVGEYEESERLHERVLKMARDQKDLRHEAMTLSSLGGLDQARGNFTRALRRMTKALEMYRGLGNLDDEAATLLGLGALHLALGTYPAALSSMEEALALFERSGNGAGLANALGRIGVLYTSLGDLKRAIRNQKRALAMRQAAGDIPAVAELGGYLASAYAMARQPERALEELTTILELSASMMDRYPAGKAHQLMGTILRTTGEPEEALDHHRQALEVFESLKERGEVAATLGELGRDHAALGHVDEAMEFLERGARDARRMRSAPVRAELLQEIAALHLVAGDAGRALDVAQTALQEVEGVLGGLGEAGASGARSLYAKLYEVGVLAGVRAESPADALLFLESGRAGALLESLEIRQEQRWAVLPEALRDAEVAAIAEVGRARRAYGKARDSSRLKEIRAAQAQLDIALEARREVAARIQREAKLQAGLFYPRAATLEEIQESLREGHVLVLYGLCLDQALAFVLTRDTERVVDLGSSAAVLEAAAALDVSEPETEPEDALTRLRALLVEPLSLDEDATTVLVSPPGALCYVPWGALLDRPVVVTASGTTHALLASAERERGEKVLALGDPHYAGTADGAAAVYHRGAVLSPLPATRGEVKAIGDLTLLAGEATSPALRKALATRARWRSVHLACHGLIDPERPTLSSLALTPTQDHDGFLPALDVLRMTIPADLAVLSACETGKGRVVQGEGIVGLTRAFLYAGASRVLCSLWKVDDEATQALMVKFYELWNPESGEGLSAPAALRQAQAHIRAQDRWKHPFYWAAWVLWGLPE